MDLGLICKHPVVHNLMISRKQLHHWSLFSRYWLQTTQLCAPHWLYINIYSTRAREIFLRYLPPKHKMMSCYYAYLLSVFICTVQVIKYQCIPQQHAKHCGTNNTNAFPNQKLSRMRSWWMDMLLISDVGYQIEYWFFLSNAITR